MLHNVQIRWVPFNFQYDLQYDFVGLVKKVHSKATKKENTLILKQNIYAWYKKNRHKIAVIDS